MAKIIIVFAAGITFIGKQSDVDPYRLDDPRTIVMQQTGPGVINLAIAAVVGMPEYIEYSLDSARCTPTDKDLINGYIANTSGIHLANTLPTNNKRHP